MPRIPPTGAASTPVRRVVRAARDRRPGARNAWRRRARPFTGDYAGIPLYDAACVRPLRPVASARGDGLRLTGSRITNAVKCLPPANKPTPEEVRTCNHFLAADLRTAPKGAAILALGRIAHDAALRALGYRPSTFAFAHGAQHPLPEGRMLIDSYHCSRYNTNTRRLTTPMFHAVFDAIARHLQQTDRAMA